jgi:pimeloyl-ACP methyl ester carboxylesterase
MSTPPFVTLPTGARALRLATARGVFAAHEALPAGDPQGTAVLVPGYTGSKEDFIALLEPLRRAGFRVVAYDQRGQYQTSGPKHDESPYALDELALDLLAVTEAVGGRPHLLGHSFGGFVAREAVLRSASRALPWSSLTLMSTGPGRIAPSEVERTRMLLDALVSMDMEAIWQVMQSMAAEAADGEQPRLGAGVAEFIHRRWLANAPAALTAMGRRLMAEPDRVDALAGVLAEAGAAAQVVSGETDYVWPVAAQEEMAARLGAGYVRVAGAGHSPNAERPADTATALGDFWAKAQKPRDNFH